jgi:hypothetical protein
VFMDWQDIVDRMNGLDTDSEVDSDRPSIDACGSRWMRRMRARAALGLDRAPAFATLPRPWLHPFSSFTVALPATVHTHICLGTCFPEMLSANRVLALSTGLGLSHNPAILMYADLRGLCSEVGRTPVPPNHHLLCTARNLS